MTELHGVCGPGFEPVRDAFKANFDDGLEIGASVAVCVGGKPVLDLWAGSLDANGAQPWTGDTISSLRSATKIPLVICMMMLVDRGLIALDAPIATYWPAFAAGGKGKVTVRETLSHRGGVPSLDPPARFEDHFDWETITARIAAEPHWFEGAPRLAYSGIVSGFILGEVMRRTDGRTPARFWRDEVATPAGIDLQIGTPDRAHFERLSPEHQDPPLAAESDPLLDRIMAGYAFGEWTFERLSDPNGWPAAGGMGNGRSLARAGAIIANGGVLDGVRYLSEASAREIGTEQAMGECPIFGLMRQGLMVTLDHPGYPLPSPTSFYWGGAGGMLCVMDPRAGLSFGYVMNHLVATLPAEWVRMQRFWKALSTVLEALEDRTPASP